jgi:hypothetical protein
MSHRSIAASLAFALALPALGCAGVCPAPEAAPRAARHGEPRTFYRLDYLIAATEAGKAPAHSSYTLNVEDNGMSEVRLGANVPLGGGSMATPRQDVGVHVRGEIHLAGEQVSLRSDVELSAMDEPPAVRKMVAHTTVMVTPGKPAIIARMDDPTSHRRYEVTVTATRVE